MPDFMWFVIGALIGLGQIVYRLLRNSTHVEYLFQGLAVSAVLGAVVYGSILWMVFA